MTTNITLKLSCGSVIEYEVWDTRLEDACTDAIADAKAHYPEAIEITVSMTTFGDNT